MHDRTVGRYEVVGELGHGGTATVYLARQTDLGRLVALKELSAVQVADPSAARRFVRESRLAGSLNHPNVVTVHDYFEDQGTPYIAMEYLERGSLRPLMHDLTFGQIAGVLEGLLAGLGFAHERGIVHRDLKPENLLISPEGRVKIADFGIAKVTDAALAGTALTVKGTTIGTPTYMAPEQAMGQDIGPWTDLYALGVIAFELLGGRPPFDTSGTPMAILLRHVNDRPLELAALESSVDPRLSDWVAKLLVKEPEDRTQSAASAWLMFEELVLERLGPRWRQAARLPEAPLAGRTPATLPLPPDADDDAEIPAAMPQTRLATALPLAGIATAMPRSAPPAGPPTRPRRPPRSRGGWTARRLVRSLLFMTALAVAVAGALAVGSGSGTRPPADSGGVPPANATSQPATTTPERGTATPPAATATPEGGTATPPAATATPQPATPTPQAAPPARSGVGDSESDDPSDDEPDGGEP